MTRVGEARDSFQRSMKLADSILKIPFSECSIEEMTLVYSLNDLCVRLGIPKIKEIY